jgi:hypothetical protein
MHVADHRGELGVCSIALSADGIVSGWACSTTQRCTFVARADLRGHRAC